MDWWWDNPLGTMRGPYFLGLYAILIVGVTIVVRWMHWLEDESRAEPTAPLPESPNPYLAALLRGGQSEVARLVLFDLLHRGIIQEYDKKVDYHKAATTYLRRAEGTPQKSLTPLQQSVLDWLGDERPVGHVLRGSLTKAAEPHVAAIQSEAERLGLVTPAGQTSRQHFWRWLALLMIALLGTYKLSVALMTGHRNVGFLVMLGIGGSLLLLGATPVQRLTDLGRRTLAAMQTAFGSLKSEPCEIRDSETGSDMRMLLALGIFGVAALQASAYSGFTQPFHNSMSTIIASAMRGSFGSSCGSTCGSSSCGGGSGCGGGGCGGCGGD